MADTYTLISSVTVGAGGASSIDFTSIPATYTDLVLKISGRSNRADVDDPISIIFNNNVAANYSVKKLYGTGSAAGSTSALANSSYLDFYSSTSANATANTFGNTDIYIPNYAGSTQKSLSMDSVSENNATAATAGLNAGLWNQTSAINRITLYPTYGSSFNQYSTAYLYGIKNS